METDQNQATSSECYEIKQERDEEDEDIPFITTGHTTNDGSSLVTSQEESTEFNSRTQEDLPQNYDSFDGAISEQSLESGGSHSDIEMMPSFSTSQGKRRNLEGGGHLNRPIQTGAETDQLFVSDNNAMDGDSNSLKKHKAEHKCTVCGRAFKNIYHLEDHMRIHTGEKPYICSVCDKAFSRMFCLTVHMRMHTGEKPYKCTMCDWAFVTSSNLRVHMKRHAKKMIYDLKADLLNRTEESSAAGNAGDVACSSRTNNAAHIDSETKNTLRLYDMALNQIAHPKGKSFVCTVCSKAFPRSNDLKTHMKIHTGEKPFECSVCGKAFIRKKEVQAHIRIHTGEKPFECTVCNKAFSRMYCFTLHMRKHTGEKPYKCSVCGWAFVSNSNLKRHMKTHSVGNNQKGDSSDALPVKSDLKTNRKNQEVEIPIAGEIVDEALPVSSDSETDLAEQTEEIPVTSNTDG